MSAFIPLLGEELLSSADTVKTVDVLEGKVVGLYFSAHWCGPCRGFTPELAKAYSSSLANKGLEIVFVSSDQDQESFKEYYSEMPWKALPYEKRDVKTALSKKFKVRGIPTFVLLDSDGTVITSDAREAVDKDPAGEGFPWRPTPFVFEEALGNELLGQGKKMLDRKILDGKVLGLYFSAHWCPPCRGFTPALAKWYNAVKPNLPDFEIVFISSDRDQESFDEYFAEMPWLALPYSERDRKEKLSDHYEVQGIPTFVIVDKDGKVINKNGRSIPGSDPDAKEFPWYPKPVKDVSEDTEALQENPSLVIFMDGAEKEQQEAVEAALTPLAKEYADKAKEKDDEDVLHFFVGGPRSSGILQQLRRLAGLPVPLEKHEHPLNKVDGADGWYCDGCRSEAEASMARYRCSSGCDFDFCEDCNSKAVDKPEKPVVGVFFSFDKESVHVVEGVDFTNTESVRIVAKKFESGDLEMKPFPG